MLSSMPRRIVRCAERKIRMSKTTIESLTQEQRARYFEIMHSLTPMLLQLHQLEKPWKEDSND